MCRAIEKRQWLALNGYVLAMVGHLKNVSSIFAQMPNRITNVEFTTVSPTIANTMLATVHFFVSFFSVISCLCNSQNKVVLYELLRLYSRLGVQRMELYDFLIRLFLKRSVSSPKVRPLRS